MKRKAVLDFGIIPKSIYFGKLSYKNLLLANMLLGCLLLSFHAHNYHKHSYPCALAQKITLTKDLYNTEFLKGI